MIHGIGIDTESVARVEQLVAEHGDRVGGVFTKGEMQEAAKLSPRVRGRYFAAAFAGKEAVMKSLGEGWTDSVRGFEIEVRPGKGATARLSGTTAEIAKRKGVSRILISTTATKRSVMAIAVAEAD